MRTVLLHPLSVLVDGDEVVVGRTDLDSYAVFPPDGAALIERLAAGTDLDRAARWYHETYGERVDLDDFLATLDELGFLAAGPGAAPNPAAAPNPPTPGAAVPDPAEARAPLSQRIGRAAFGPPAWIGYSVLIVAAGWAWATHPGLRPDLDHVFFSHYLLVIELTLLFGQIPLVLLHEVFHLLAARRLGVRARIRVGQRMYFVVFETVLDGLVLVPRARRYLPILAGLLADLLVLAALTVTAWATARPDGTVSVLGGVCLGLAFTTVMRIAFEFLIFLRTDLYHLISTVCGCIDLHGTSRERLRDLGRRLAGRPTLARHAHPRDLRVARWYTPLHVAGYGLAVGLLVVVVGPLMWRFLGAAGSALLTGDLASARFWDAAGLLLLNTAEPLVAGVLALRDRRSAAHPTRKR